MKTVTKYICEVTNKEFATEKEAKECEQFEQRVQEAASKHRPNKQLTVRELHHLSGSMGGNLYLRVAAGLLPVKRVFTVCGQFFLETGLATGESGCVTNDYLYRELNKANSTHPVFLKVGPSDGFPTKVIGLTPDADEGRCVVEVAYNLK